MELTILIEEAKQGMQGAQKCLFDLYRKQIYIICRSYVKVQEDAEECLLDSFLKIFKGLADFNFLGEGAFFQWMKKIAIYQCLMFLRAQNLYSLVPEIEAEDISFKEEALDNMATDELNRMVLQLPVGCRSVFNLYAIEGYNHIEIGNLLGIAEGTSKSQLANARKLLQKWIIEKEKYYDKFRSK